VTKDWRKLSSKVPHNFNALHLQFMKFLCAHPQFIVIRVLLLRLLINRDDTRRLLSPPHDVSSGCERDDLQICRMDAIC